MMVLREHQKKAIKQLQIELKKGFKNPLLCLPCGSGKTVIAVQIMNLASKKGNETLFLVDRQELYTQTLQTLKRYGVDENLAKVSMVVNARNNKDSFNPSIIFVDECNFSLANTWQEVLQAYPNSIKVGLSATPIRLDGTRMSDQYDSIIQPVQVSELIEQKFLASYKYLTVDLDEDDDELGRSLYCSNIVENFTKHASNKQTIVFCTSIEHSEKMTQSFRDAGYVAEHLDANTPQSKREVIIERFKTGGIQILCNVFLLCYGFDAPSCKCVVLLAKTESYAKYHQSVMRAMRPYNDEQALILDFVQNVKVHGLPDTVIEWDLSTGRNKNEKSSLLIKQCPECFAWLLNLASKCSYCEHDFSEQLRRQTEKEAIEAELIEYQERLRNAPYSDVKNITTWEGLVEFQKAKKYKFAWCFRQAQEKGISIPYKYIKMKFKAGV